MPISRIQITNFGAITNFDADNLPSVILVQGGNGVGKSSFLDAIKYIGESGHDPDILHGNAESGEVIVTFSDGNQVRAAVTRKSTTRGWKPKDGKKWQMDRKLIDQICNAISYDPLSFLKLKESEQAVKLLEIAPIEVAPEEIRAAVGGAEAEIKGLQVKTGMNGLEVIDATYDYLYSARTPLNTGAQVQEAHATELERALPPAAPDGTDWGKEADRLQGEKNKIEAAEASELGALRTDFEAAKAREQKKHDAERAEIDTDINAKISALEKERAERYGKSAAALTEAIEYARKVGNEEAVRIRGDYKPRVEQVTGELATAQERFRAQEQGEGTRKAIVVARQEAAVSKARAGVITEALERLKKLKVAAAGRLKIPGVIVKDGRIFREQDGGLTPLRKWNTADQVTFCLRLAIMVNGKAGFTVVDDAEHFEQAKFDALVATCKKYAAGEKAQFIVARVSSGALKVEGA